MTRYNKSQNLTCITCTRASCRNTTYDNQLTEYFTKICFNGQMCEVLMMGEFNKRSSILLFVLRRFFCNFSILCWLLVLACFIKVLRQVRNLIIVILSSSSLTKTSSSGHIAGQSLQMSQTLSSQLVEDAGQHLGYLFVFCVSCHSECVSSKRSLDLGVVEVDDGSIILDHVHLLNAGDVVD